MGIAASVAQMYGLDEAKVQQRLDEVVDDVLEFETTMSSWEAVVVPMEHTGVQSFEIPEDYRLVAYDTNAGGLVFARTAKTREQREQIAFQRLADELLAEAKGSPTIVFDDDIELTSEDLDD